MRRPSPPEALLGLAVLLAAGILVVSLKTLNLLKEKDPMTITQEMTKDGMVMTITTTRGVAGPWGEVVPPNETAEQFEARHLARVSEMLAAGWTKVQGQ